MVIELLHQPAIEDLLGHQPEVGYIFLHVIPDLVNGCLCTCYTPLGETSQWHLQQTETQLHVCQFTIMKWYGMSCSFAGMRNLLADAPDLPWASSAPQLSAARAQARSFRLQDKFTCVPSGIAHIDFDKALGLSGSLKSSEYLLLAGPYGKYVGAGPCLALSGCGAGFCAG